MSLYLLTSLFLSSSNLAINPGRKREISRAKKKIDGRWTKMVTP